MQKRSDSIGFTTPAFLGNAEQQAQWRTPPLKALLRQWWRVLEWNRQRHDLESLRRKEADWFGVAADDGGESRQSQVRLRLDAPWSEGERAEWPATAPLTHSEVKVKVQADLYLGFGPITTKSRRSALPPDKPVQFRIAAPDDFPLDDLMQLVARFGTLGSRSRNGWGSLHVDNVTQPSAELLQRISRPLDDCLRQDWPHALGRDEQGLLIWKTPPQANWREAMRELARVKIAFRTQFQFNGGGPHHEFQPRHLLAYPVTKHSLAVWDKEKNARNASQLRFKVIKEGNRYVGLAFHLPCALPLPGGPASDRQADIWRQVHTVLNQQMTRTGDGQ